MLGSGSPARNCSLAVPRALNIIFKGKGDLCRQRAQWHGCFTAEIPACMLPYDVTRSSVAL
eukprot:1134132-Pelagomonas_calceolata.AAC.2